MPQSARDRRGGDAEQRGSDQDLKTQLAARGGMHGQFPALLGHLQRCSVARNGIMGRTKTKPFPWRGTASPIVAEIQHSCHFRLLETPLELTTLLQRKSLSRNIIW